MFMKTAHIVLAYSAEHENKVLSATDIEPIVKTSAALSSGQSLDNALELQFWETYSKLAETLKPSSVSEIVTYCESQQQHFSLKTYLVPVIAVPIFTVTMLLSLFYATDGTLLAKSLYCASYLDCARASAPIDPAPPNSGEHTVSAVEQAISVAAVADNSANCLAVTDPLPQLKLACQSEDPDKPHQNFLIDELGYSLYEWRKVYFFSVKSKSEYLDEKLSETNSFVFASYELEKAPGPDPTFQFLDFCRSCSALSARLRRRCGRSVPVSPKSAASGRPTCCSMSFRCCWVPPARSSPASSWPPKACLPRWLTFRRWSWPSWSATTQISSSACSIQ